MIREARQDDLTAIAEIEVAGSLYAYKGIVPDEYLDSLSVGTRLPVYKRWTAEKRFDIYVYENGQNIIGMMGTGKCEDEDKHGASELHFIYVDPHHVRKGIGSSLLQFFEQQAKERGCTENVVWVLEENTMGRRFYEKHGYVPDGHDKIFMRWNKREIRYIRQV